MKGILSPMAEYSESDSCSERCLGALNGAVPSNGPNLLYWLLDSAGNAITHRAR